ncbi:MAG: PD40 domain-containing protein [Balneolaceae bacterium]|nr:PD40 domain-containing protein [Balneolaceae bacterium]
MSVQPKLLFLFLFLTFYAKPASAQFYPTQYRPPVNWQQLSTDHFKIIFPQGEDSAAYNTARILEEQYPGVQKLTGGSLTNFPVILTNYNDRSNGIVTTLHFRSEIDIPPIQGKALNPKTGGWLQNVVPHELVHALQFSNLGGFGLGRIVNIFSPDLARSLHGAPPSGIQEGLATYYESEFVAQNGGRGNYPFFTNPFDAIFTSPGRWSMGQMVHFPIDTRPFNRHYIGGYTFTKWLQDTYGEKTSRDAIDFHVRWPFLGYGVALKHATGRWPAQLYDAFEKNQEAQLKKKNSQTDVIRPLSISLDGAEIRRPKWLSDSTLIFHGSFYNADPGFYRYTIPDGSLQRIITTSIGSDYNYAISDDRKTLIYSYYKPDAIYPNAFNSTLVKASLKNGASTLINSDRRLFSPSLSADSSLISLERHKSINRIIKINLTNSLVNSVLADPSYQIVSAAAHPTISDSLAVIMNRNGSQALWLASEDHLKEVLSDPPTISFSDGSVFDPIWHPDGKSILFSADFSGDLQIYEYNLRTAKMIQWTNAPYNAFEASYSPDGNTIAFVIQKENERLPAVLSRNDIYSTDVLTDPSFSPHQDVSSQSNNNWNSRSYKTGLSWLKPRTVLPAIEEISGSNQYKWGVGLHSNDLLQQQAYSVELTAAEERLWYDLTYQNKQFFPGFRARIFSKPAFRTFRFDPDNESPFTQTFLRQERSFALSMPVQFTFEQNVDFTGLFIEPEFRQSQLRYFNQDKNNATDFSNASIGNIYAQFNYKLQQNIRDVQPNSGLQFYAELEHFFHSGSVSLETTSGQQTLNFANPTALRGGLSAYLSPLQQWNQSLRIGAEAITQTHPVFDAQSVVSDGFSERVLSGSNNLVSINTRYTIPLVYPDDGGFLLPLYLSNIYLVGFTDTVTDPTANDVLQSSRSVFGAGVRIRFRISNLSLDIGAGIGVEPSRNNIHYFIGDF